MWLWDVHVNQREALREIIEKYLRGIKEVFPVKLLKKPDVEGISWQW